MELLVVIGILTILAVGLLAAIDPLEQLKKARDTNARKAAVETLSAFQRYYATHGDYPWALSTPPASCDPNLINLDTVAVELDPGGSAGAAEKLCMEDSLIADGELKTRFFEGLQNSLFLDYDATDAIVTVCFSPESKSQRNDSMTKYLFSGGAITEQTGGVGGNACPDATEPNCLQCFQ